jgi:hypothetical protein
MALLLFLDYVVGLEIKYILNFQARYSIGVGKKWRCSFLRLISVRQRKCENKYFFMIFFVLAIILPTACLLALLATFFYMISLSQKREKMNSQDSLSILSPLWLFTNDNLPMLPSPVTQRSNWLLDHRV